LAEELWERLGHESLIAVEGWPAYDPGLCEDAEIELPIQINGKVRSRVTLAKDASEEQARALALADPLVQRSLQDKALKKLVYVPGRILNLIVN
jgi:leucyl-tRNA synthetase